MQKLIQVIILITLSVVLSGCGNLSPRLNPQLQQQLDKIQGDQATLENNQNATRIELGRLQNELDLQGNDNDLQQGWINIRSDGLIIGVFSVIIISLLFTYMYKTSQYKKASEIMANEIKQMGDWELKEKVMAAAWNTRTAKTIYKMIQ